MSPNDPRHGQPRGWSAGCREDCCRHAMAVYNETRKLKQLRGLPTSSWQPNVGTRRRLQALVALGWSFPRIAEHIGLETSFLRSVATKQRLVANITADRVARVYDQLAMRRPPENTRWERQGASRARATARKHGWVPPLAWDDDEIDDPKARPRKGYRDRSERMFDMAVVLRLVDTGVRVRRLTTREAAEAVEILRRRGVSGRQIEDDYGLNPGRYDDGGEDAA